MTLRARCDDGSEIVSAHAGLDPPPPGTRVAAEISRDAVVEVADETALLERRAGVEVGLAAARSRETELEQAASAALPLVTVLTLVWLHVEGQGETKIANHAWYTFWYVVPTLPMFHLIPWLLKKGMGFPLVMVLAALLTVGAFFLTAALVRRFGIDLY